MCQLNELPDFKIKIKVILGRVFHVKLADDVMVIAFQVTEYNYRKVSSPSTH
jgi:hypothetical protein